MQLQSVSATLDEQAPRQALEDLAEHTRSVSTELRRV